MASYTEVLFQPLRLLQRQSRRCETVFTAPRLRAFDRPAVSSTISGKNRGGHNTQWWSWIRRRRGRKGQSWTGGKTHTGRQNSKLPQ
ncbi:unnamed protein product [Pleuronectes platessa]|uniref:Uncharacterized protein n=1 Tax=Pleuronectes platessa TaxID=8262 RepID=A0A9N7YSN8_PLEPL|nr:unnamed protein product [Pleuronectes platessa]